MVTHDAVTDYLKRFAIRALEAAMRRKNKTATRALQEVVTSGAISDDLKRSALSALERAARTGNHGAVRAIGALVQPLTTIITDENTTDQLKHSAIDALGRAAKSSKEARDVIDTMAGYLQGVITNDATDSSLGTSAITILKGAALRGNEKAIDVIDSMVENFKTIVLRDTGGFDFKESAINILGDTVDRDNRAAHALKEIVISEAGSNLRRLAIYALGNAALRGSRAAAEDLNGIVTSDAADSGLKKFTVHVLGTAATPTVLVGLGSSREAVHALTQIGTSGGVDPQDRQSALGALVTSGSLRSTGSVLDDPPPHDSGSGRRPASPLIVTPFSQVSDTASRPFTFISTPSKDTKTSEQVLQASGTKSLSADDLDAVVRDSNRSSSTKCEAIENLIVGALDQGDGDAKRVLIALLGDEGVESGPRGMICMLLYDKVCTSDEGAVELVAALSDHLQRIVVSPEHAKKRTRTTDDLYAFVYPDEPLADIARNLLFVVEDYKVDPEVHRLLTSRTTRHSIT